ncbi:MAG: recombination protein O N-terminal domain-containing protein, partial [Bacteroidia bacterium]|nr:recombination protein O N-terminal domain-containing protein [Bacteroidia bacterium]
MLQKTRAIVLDITPYAEASIIVKAYTETMGLQSFLVNGVRKPKA